ncbi:protein of unknown function [Marinospirillum celere]|uniref:DUF349 domain-containing protein n=1 Tax=Marinospirillum celere TaxID=1122252 RepID=A0A1I1JPS1_9GAMM|nr:DUF349 domain-containing protein [Marinospirillum celere]SFC49952.1 protein of unknown function [Marinospirillum celere]
MNSLLVRIAPRFFKPSLEHSKRSIRFMALQRLDLQDKLQQQHFLEWLEKEKDPQLVQNALPLFPEPEQLASLLEKPLQPAVTNLLIQYLVEQLTDPGKEEAERKKLLEKIQQPGLLLAVISSANEQEMRLQAMQQLESDEADWLEIALSNSMARVRYQAASQIQQETSLEQLVKEAQGDKRVLRLARERLTAIRAKQQEALEARDHQQKLVRELEQHLNSKDQQLFAARLEHMQRQWSQLQHFPAPASLTQRYQELLKMAQQRAEQLAAEEKALRLAEQQKQAARQEQKQLFEQLQLLQNQLANTLSEQGDLLHEEFQQLQAAWTKSTSQHLAEPNLAKQWQLSLNQLHPLLTSWQTFKNHLPELQILLAESEWSSQQLRAAQKLISLINWPLAIQAPAEIHELQELVKELKPFQPEPTVPGQPPFNEQSCLNKLQLLEGHLDEGNSRDAQKILQQLQDNFAAAPTSFRNQQSAYFNRLTARVAELKDWQGFVAAPKRESLCEQMEALAEDQSMEPQAKADRIQALQQEWKELGSAAMNKALWKRFKAAADLAYEPCKAWFAEQAQQREYNQQQRRIICEELEKLTSSNQRQELDENALDQLLTQVHEEWRRFNPVNRAEGKRLAERFQLALQPIKDHLYQLRKNHAEQKRELIKAAKALLEETDIKAATATSKDLQKQWRDLGKAPGSLEHQLWKEFRTACDRLFERRDQQKDEHLQQQQDNLKQARELLNTAELALSEGDLELALEKQREASTIRPLPRSDQSGWDEQLQKFKKQLQLARQQQQKQKQLNQLLSLWEALPDDQPLENTELARKLTLQLETLAGISSPEEDQALKMQLQVERLNAGIKGEAAPQEKTQEAEEALKTWQEAIASRQGPLGQRFILALQQLHQA